MTLNGIRRTIHDDDMISFAEFANGDNEFRLWSTDEPPEFMI
jgi:hypothetical protein